MILTNHHYFFHPSKNRKLICRAKLHCCSFSLFKSLKFNFQKEKRVCDSDEDRSKTFIFYGIKEISHHQILITSLWTSKNEDQLRIERDVQQLKSMLQCKRPESNARYRALALIQNTSTW